MRSRVTHLPVIFALGALAACASGGGGGGGAVVPGGATGNGGAASNSGNGNSNSNGAGGSNSGQPPAITQPPLVQAVVTYSDDPTKPLSWNVVGSGSGMRSERLLVERWVRTPVSR